METETLATKLAKMTAQAFEEQSRERRIKEEKEHKEHEKILNERARKAVKDFFASIPEEMERVAQEGGYAVRFTPLYDLRSHKSYEELLSFIKTSKIFDPLREFCLQNEMTLQYNSSQTPEEVTVFATVSWGDKLAQLTRR